MHAWGTGGEETTSTLDFQYLLSASKLLFTLVHNA